MTTATDPVVEDLTDRDTRVEELKAGDQLRYLGEWLDVVDVRGTYEAVFDPEGAGLADLLGKPRPLRLERRITVVTDERTGEPYELEGLDGQVVTVVPRRTFVYWPGVFVAARTMAEVYA